MILYFSATGNSKYVAERISEKTDEKVAKFTKNTETQIDFIIDKIGEKEKGKFMGFAIPKFVVDTVMEPIYNNKVRKTSNFVLEDTCVGCGLCAKK